jgi:hypothetical protein
VQATSAKTRSVTRTALRPGMFRIFCWQARVCRRLALCSIESIAKACKRIC